VGIRGFLSSCDGTDNLFCQNVITKCSNVAFYTVVARGTFLR